MDVPKPLMEKGAAIANPSPAATRARRYVEEIPCQDSSLCEGENHFGKLDYI